MCEPGAQVPCYTGPPSTADVGICRRGVATCSADGSELGACIGEVTPAPETCTDPADEDCDGQANEEGSGCACVPGDAAPCYGGPPGTGGVGICKAGTKFCDTQGTGYGPCIGEVLPTADDCHTAADENCDGVNASCAAGEHLWSRSFGIVLVKLDPVGAHLWSKRFGDSLHQQPASLAVDGAGSAICAGAYSGALDLGGGALWPAGTQDAFLAKFSP
ncbi:hypothetical protein [Sorangium sp. So ce1335]|uniref:hypothetical protein n=1 Tax=Sorangium sp. So ce1335 TaxID=3133335 RepID=UPI003F633DD9